MKTCPNCQDSFNDDSLKFCLSCGTPLPQTVEPRKSGGGAIAAAILAGFIILAAVVGGLGWYIFSREPKETVQTANANNSPKSGEDEADAPQNTEKIPSVEQLNSNRKTVPFPSNSSNSVSNSAAPRTVASSSSVRKEDRGNFYFPNFAFDKNSATAWSEGVKGAGMGEWLQFNFNREVTLKQIRMQPGYFKSSETWSKNNRLAAVSLQFSDGETRRFSFPDEMKTQPLEMSEKRTKWVKITLEDYYRGSSDAEDTLISEVSFTTEP